MLVPKMLSFSFRVTTSAQKLPSIKQHGFFPTIWNSSSYKADVSNVVHTSFSLLKSLKISAANANSGMEGSNVVTVAGKILPGGLQPELMPKHVAVVMDGNRRWASERGLSAEDAYRAGRSKTKEIARLCHEWEVKVLTVFAFSTENWARPKEEVEYLMNLYEEMAKWDTEGAMRYGIQITVIGDTSKLPESLKRSIELAERNSKDKIRLHLIFALNYSGQQDILQATRKIASKVEDGKLQFDDIDAKLFEEELQTNCTEFPNPDLLIRTSDKFYPDLEEADFIEAISSFQQRQRRFGG